MEEFKAKARAGAHKIHHLNIPGFDRIFGPGNHRWQRVLWLAGVLLCFGISVHQIAMHIIQYWSEPVAVRMEFIPNKTLDIPEITMCPVIFLKNPSFIKFIEKRNISRTRFLDLVDQTEYDIQSLWNLTQMFSENVSCTAHEGSSIINGSYIDHDILSVHHVYTTSGKCINIRARRQLYYRGVNTFIRITDPNSIEVEGVRPDAVQVYFHERNHSHLSRYMTGLRGYIVPIDDAFAFAIGFTQIKYVNKTSEPCVTSLEYSMCVEQFIEQRIYQLAGVECRLPYMNPPQKYCSSTKDARKIFIATDSVTQNFEKDSKCLPKCEENLYKAELITMSKESNMSIDVSVYFTDNYIQMATQYRTYTHNDLLSDMGGVLGLFLGVCILSVIEVIEVIIFSVHRIFCKDDKKQ